ncbi:hypothetical protein K505DRAFT_416711 [Melanomma pulvis-pyrius CBS 109.77]|uniref:Fungal N-terminal domain-containing protein n=1 Tax=Melanomma pulvis-pyrius CBS 109.77 TaxID=1314802 RepID=A0A6A6XG68_9PLEO|nr:hypothetical protein K505DRAFT_416711 [Melanomma pulvis-pyrius CBS 109.77]
MEAVSIIALVGSGLAVATKTLKALNDLSQKNTNVEQSTQLLISKLSTVRAALSQLQALLQSDRAERFITPQLQSDLSSAMYPCTVVMGAIHQHVRQIQEGWLKGRIRYLWDEKTISEHSVHLDSQISALNLLLQVIQLSSSNEQHKLLERRISRRILQKAQSDASSYLSDSDESSSLNRSARFDFDNELINSDAYLLAFRKWRNAHRHSGQQAEVSPQNSVRQSSNAPTLDTSDVESFTNKRELTGVSRPSRAWTRLGGRREWKLSSKSPKLSRKKSLWLLAITLLTLSGVIVAVVTTQVLRSRTRPPISQDVNPTPSPSPSPSPSPFPSGFPVVPLSERISLNSTLVTYQTGCVAPATIWSCNLPKEEQVANTQNGLSHLMFQMEILLKNSSMSPSATLPSIADQNLLGSTTDNISIPISGIETPFYVAFGRDTTSSLTKRQNSAVNITNEIPPPTLNSDGTAAPAMLFPSTVTQPLRLYNKGLSEEHYGFYMYFDKSIFVQNISGTVGRDGSTNDQNGGASFDSAKFRCVFAQTRFHVQIWTASTPASSDPASTYRITSSLDRHGGDARTKNAYCYDIEADGTIIDDTSHAAFIFEDRAFGGKLVDPTAGRTVTADEAIDGGTGGCQCVWKSTYT